MHPVTTNTSKKRIVVFRTYNKQACLDYIHVGSDYNFLKFSKSPKKAARSWSFLD